MSDGGPYWKEELPLGPVVLHYSDGHGEAGSGEFDHIIADLQADMPGYNVRQYFGSQPGIFHKYDHLVVARDAATRRAVGLFGARWFSAKERNYLYFWTAMVTEAHRRTAVTSAMVLWNLERAAASRGAPDVLASKTYSPVAFQALALLPQVFPEMAFYPRLDGGPQDPDLVALAAELTAMLCPALRVDLEQAIVFGGQAVLAPDFFPNPMPLSGDARVDGFFSRLTRDDQILVLAEVPRAMKSSFASALAAAKANRFRLRRKRVEHEEAAGRRPSLAAGGGSG